MVGRAVLVLIGAGMAGVDVGISPLGVRVEDAVGRGTLVLVGRGGGISLVLPHAERIIALAARAAIDKICRRYSRIHDAHR